MSNLKALLRKRAVMKFEDNFIAGFGGGLRLTLPVVVLLRLDVGYSPQHGFLVAIGGSEKAVAQRARVR